VLLDDSLTIRSRIEADFEPFVLTDRVKSRLLKA
jgi:hypothetical protein